MMKTKDLLYNLLNESQEKECLLSIYDNKNDIDKFYVGYVVEIFDDSILLYSYNENGEEDGYLLIRLVDIFKIEKGSLYLTSFSYLIKQNDSTNRKQNWKVKNSWEEGIAEIISMCHEQKVLVTIKLIYEVFIVGYVIEKDDDFLLIEEYSKSGMQDGHNLIYFRDIQNIHFEGKEEKNIIKLIKTGVLS